MINISKEDSKPYIIGKFNIFCNEMMFYMYLPILFPEHNIGDIYDNVPKRLSFLKPLIDKIEIADLENNYVYLTVKNTYVSPESMSQRMGWHIDGYMTGDVNYIWYSEVPTEFSIGEFLLQEDHRIALDQMKQQASQYKITTFPNNSFIRLKAKEVHRVNENHNYEGMRLFVKISCSKHKFNLEGNSHNYLLDYSWQMHDRNKVRNMENNGDFQKDDL